ITIMTNTLEQVIEPTAPESMNIFQWNNEELQKWARYGTTLQDRHVADNNKSSYG
ncbi:unnamed protein product, partial [Didymodactylos carnosus]